MFTIDPDAHVTAHPPETDLNAFPHGTDVILGHSGLWQIVQTKPGEWAVKVWNQLPGVVPIQTPKFRNKSTAIERIWKKLAELYPDAIVAEEMPKQKERHEPQTKPFKHLGPEKRTVAKTAATASAKKKTRNAKSWAEELIEELRKRYKPGQDFTLPDVYKLIPAFQRRHKGNQHIAARLRTTLAQDLRGNGIVKTLGKGKYRLV